MLIDLHAHTKGISHCCRIYAPEVLGDEAGMPVLFGIEVTMERHENQHLLVYGVKEDFPLACPIRKGNDVRMDPKFLDGVEVNCHPLYDATHHEMLAQYAKAHGMFLTCGGDYHADTHRATCGLYLPEHITTGVELGQYLRQAKTLSLCVQEVGCADHFLLEYER